MVVTAAEQSFYEASAQVIPVLLLVLAIELVRYRAPREPVWVAYTFMGTVLGMILGEVAALAALAEGSDSFFTASFTAGGIGVGVNAVFMRAGLLARDNLRIEQSAAVADRFEFVITLVGAVVGLGVTGALLLVAT
jgi:hypothetical protein